MTTYTIHDGDFLQWLRDNHQRALDGDIPKAHAVICDPPYFLGSIVDRYGKPDAAPAGSALHQRLSTGFMGQTWDGFESLPAYQAWVTEWSHLLIDFVHPGAVLLAFGGTRTFHRLMCGIEDAGWTIYDSILVWMYGDGFPKNTNVSKLLDRAAGHTNKQSDYGTITEEARAWSNHGAALKPSFEPIVYARAPRQGQTFIDAAQTHGASMLNIEGCRIGTETVQSGGGRTTGHAMHKGIDYDPDTIGESTGRWPANTMIVCECDGDEHDPDCPARMIDAQSGESTSTGGGGPDKVGVGGHAGFYSGQWGARDLPQNVGYLDSGGASRFFYQAKAQKWEREIGLEDRAPQKVNDGRKAKVDTAHQRGETGRKNTHPTVKPIQLTAYLARLVLPPAHIENRRIMIPFAGSGSEMIGAMLAGWDHVDGFEMEPEYIEIAHARIAWWRQYDSYAQAQRAATAEHDAQKQRAEELQHGVQQLSFLD